MKKFSAKKATAAAALTGALMAGSCGTAQAMTFVVGGTGDPNAQFVPSVPPGPRQGIHYPAAYPPSDESLEAGRRELDNRARQYRKDHPSEHITVTGYSQGAWVAGDVCDSWQSDPGMSRNTDCHLVSDPRRPGGGIVGVLPSVVPGLHHTGPRTKRGPLPVHQECSRRDPICALPNPVTDLVGAVDAGVGWVQGTHGTYPTKDPAPALTSSLPTPYDALEPVAREVVPVAPIRDHYVPTRLGDLIPPALDHVLPRQITDWVPPAL